MSSFKKLSKADITSVPYYANKQWNYLYTSSSIFDEAGPVTSQGYDVFGTGSDIVYYKGRKDNFDINGLVTTNNQYQSLVYTTINHLFYQEYSDTLDTGSLMFNVNTYESASEQRPTSSYFDYNINPLLVKNFPTSSSSQIVVLSINKDIYGSKVLPHTFCISSSLFDIRDDGNGNIRNISGSINEHVGNVFYAHGIITITNQNYINIFPSGSTPTGSSSIIHLYSNFSPSLNISGSGTGSIYYKIDGGSYNLVGPSYGTSCIDNGTILVPNGSTLYIGVTSASLNVNFGITNTSCLASLTTPYCGILSPFTTIISASMDITISPVVVDGSGSGLKTC